MIYTKRYFLSGYSNNSKHFDKEIYPKMGTAKYAKYISVSVISQSTSVQSTSFVSHEATLKNMFVLLCTTKESSQFVQITIEITFEAYSEIIDLDLCLIPDIENNIFSWGITPLSWNKGAIVDYSVVNTDPPIEQDESILLGDRTTGYVFNSSGTINASGLHSVQLEIVYAEAIDVYTQYSDFEEIPITTPSEFNVTYNYVGFSLPVPTESSKMPNTQFLIADAPSTEVINGYTFKGWQDVNTFYLPNEKYIMPDRDVAFIAVWSKREDTDLPQPPDPIKPVEDTHIIKINNWNTPNEPLILSGIYIDVEIQLDEKNLKSIERTIMERSDTNKPSFGIISNTGRIDFNDIDGEVRDYAEQMLLKEGLTATITLNNTLTGAQEVVGILKTADWDYDKYSREVSVSLKDDLEEWQEIVAKQKKWQVQTSLLDVYVFLKQQTPVKYNFEQLTPPMQMYLSSIKADDFCLSQENLWGQWEEFCDVGGLYVYINKSGNIDLSKEE